MPDNKDVKLTSINVNIMTVIQIIVFVATILGVYFTMKADVDAAQEKITKIEQQLDQNNLELINYKLDQLLKQLEKLDSNPIGE